MMDEFFIGLVSVDSASRFKARCSDHRIQMVSTFSQEHQRPKSCPTLNLDSICSLNVIYSDLFGHSL
jgi:hypothetical protein